MSYERPASFTNQMLNLSSMRNGRDTVGYHVIRGGRKDAEEEELEHSGDGMQRGRRPSEVERRDCGLHGLLREARCALPPGHGFVHNQGVVEQAGESSCPRDRASWTQTVVSWPGPATMRINFQVLKTVRLGFVRSVRVPIAMIAWSVQHFSTTTEAFLYSTTTVSNLASTEHPRVGIARRSACLRAGHILDGATGKHSPWAVVSSPRGES